MVYYNVLSHDSGTIAVNMWYRGDRARLEEDLPASQQVNRMRIPISLMADKIHIVCYEEG